MSGDDFRGKPAVFRVEFEAVWTAEVLESFRQPEQPSW